MKDALCKAFCADLLVQKVPAGLAVSHASWTFGDDPICMYLTGPDPNGLWVIQDDGTTIPYIEATGADLGVPARAEVFRDLLGANAASYREETCEVVSAPMGEDEIPAAAIRFLSLLVRLQDLSLLSRERVEQTWMEEVERELRHALPGKAAVTVGGSIAPCLDDYRADIVIQAEGMPPVALFFGTSDAKAYEALLLRTQAKYHYKIDAPVILVLENDSGISKKQRLRADANLIVPRYRGAEVDAIGRIVEEATGSRPEYGVMH